MPAIASLEDLKSAQKGKLLSPQSALLSTDESWLEEYLQAVVGREKSGAIER
jgi:hypothetical protein